MVKHKENKTQEKTQESMHFVGLNKSKATSKSTLDEEAKKPVTTVDDLPSPQDDEEEKELQETENHQNKDDRREEMHEAMAQIRKDAETGCEMEMELALTPKGSAQSEEEKYQPTPPPQQQDDSEAEDSHQGSPREKMDEEEEREKQKEDDKGDEISSIAQNRSNDENIYIRKKLGGKIEGIGSIGSIGSARRRKK